MIVLNELDWARDMIERRSIGKKPFETLTRVAKYFLSEKHSKSETRRMMDMFLLQCDPNASLPKWSDTLDAAVAKAQKNDPIVIDYITINKEEIDVIDKLDGVQLRRLAFTLLCLAKYWNTVNSNDDCWVSNKDSDIMRMANINTSIKRQSLLYHTLNELGLIHFSKKVDNTNVKVCFASDGDAAMDVSDFRNLGYQYMLYHGDRNYIKCQNCGIVVRKNMVVPKERPKITGRPQMYCRECSSSSTIKDKVERTMRK